jgi:hypothetical protein
MASDAHLVPITDDMDSIIEVGRELSKGKTNKVVAMELNLKPRDVAKLGEQYRTLTLQTAKNNQNFADRLTVSLEESMQHFDMLIKDAWDNKEDASLNQEFNVVNTSIRLLKDLAEVKFKMIHAMTEGQDVDLMADLENMHEEVEMLKGILRDMKDKYPEAARFVFNRMNELGGIEVVV